ncbi:hypothetical protein SPHINGOT1_270140 [Sphingomonas sp. T1]|nr:hypothetical protein SPHINGOT1_270140 [Sphingomonas sp. T1]
MLCFELRHLRDGHCFHFLVTNF